MTRDDWLDNAQICLNGHVITEFAISQPNSCENFCNKCGQPTIRNCPTCEESIRGYRHMTGVIYTSESVAPNFCINCGNSYPWTKIKLDAAKELVQMQSNITSEEQETLNQSIDDIVKDTPRTNIAVLKFKHLMGKVGIETASALKEILIGITTEAAKKALGW
ncbi:MAG: DUF2321 domain-containing protein [Nitrosotalea sp.]